MKFNKLTVGLAAVGVVSLASAACADETSGMTKLDPALGTALSNTTISGYVDTAAVWRPGTDQRGDFGPNIPYYAFAQNDGFYLNSVDIAIDRPQDETPWAAGYHVELMFGDEAVPEANWSSYPERLGYGGIRQAYLALRTPIGNSGIDWKVGVFDSIIGYESSSDPLNPNYTRSYGYTIEPTTQTGIVGTYKINDMISVSAGIANQGNDDFFSNAINRGSLNSVSVYESQKTYMAAIALTAPDSWGWLKGATLNGGVINSVDSWAYGNGSWTSWYAGVTIPTPLTALKIGGAFDFLAGHNGQGDQDVFGLYANYQVNDKLSVNLRAEYGQGDIRGLLYTYGAGGRGQFNAEEEFTATLQYQLWANVLSRVEFRWDHVEDGNWFGVGSYSYYEEEYGYPNRCNDFMLALNLIYQF